MIRGQDRNVPDLFFLSATEDGEIFNIECSMTNVEVNRTVDADNMGDIFISARDMSVKFR
jgi:hypothetical protein